MDSDHGATTHPAVYTPEVSPENPMSYGYVKPIPAGSFSVVNECNLHAMYT